MNKAKKKQSYSIANNLGYAIKNMVECSKSLTIKAIVRAPFVVLSSFLTLYLSRAVVEWVTAGVGARELIYQVIKVSLWLTASLCLERYLDTQSERFMLCYDMFYQLKMGKKSMQADYETMESAKGMTRAAKANEFTGTDLSCARIFTKELSNICSSLIGIIFYGALLFQLSGLLLLVVSASTLAGYGSLKLSVRWTYRNKDHWKGADRKLSYILKNSSDFTQAKDLRLYRMEGWFSKVFDKVLRERLVWLKKEKKVKFAALTVQNLLTLVREAAAYGSLILLMMTGNYTVADFVLYIGIISGFSEFLSALSNSFNQYYRFHLGVTEVREFLEFPDKSNKEDGLPVPDETFAIEFRNVCYRFSGMEKDTIHNLSFIIHKGEHLAIVGENGAGKTTLVKLLCGLYEPTSGEILINGIPIRAFNAKEYYGLFAAVFQDIFMLPLSIARNVAAGHGEPEEGKIRKVLGDAGLLEKVDLLPNGIHTRLIKSVYDDAIDLSGGELQKLALARALYKDGKALILDEPTAALDPIAENHIYEEYQRMTKGATSVFISHRLASTRFCHRIFLLEAGQIAECGSHEELMEERGKYFKMFEIQSKYYREGGTEDEG